MSRFAVDPRWLVLPAADDGAGRDVARSTATWSTRTRRSTSYAPTGVDEVVCEEKHMGSRAVAVRLPGRPRRRRSGSASADGDAAPSTPAPAGRSSTRPGPRSWSSRLRAACAAGCGTSSAPTGWCSTASCCRGRPRRGELIREPVRRRRRRRAGRAARAVSALEAAAGARAGRGRPAGPHPARAGNADAFTRRLPALLLAGRRAGRGAAGAVPAAGRRRARVPTTASRTPGTWRRRPLRRRRPRADHADPARRRLARPAAVAAPRRSRGGRR